jgi:hypothetical protein
LSRWQGFIWRAFPAEVGTGRDETPLSRPRQSTGIATRVSLGLGVQTELKAWAIPDADVIACGDHLNDLVLTLLISRRKRSWRRDDGERPRFANTPRQTFKDLVHLAAEESDRAAELYVLGERPIRFLQTSTSKASWGLDRSLSTQGCLKKSSAPWKWRSRISRAGLGRM